MGPDDSTGGEALGVLPSVEIDQEKLSCALDAMQETRSYGKNVGKKIAAGFSPENYLPLEAMPKYYALRAKQQEKLYFRIKEFWYRGILFSKTHLGRDETGPS